MSAQLALSAETALLLLLFRYLLWTRRL